MLSFYVYHMFKNNSVVDGLKYRQYHLVLVSFVTSASVEECCRMLRTAQGLPSLYSGRLTLDQVAMLEAQFNKIKTLHSTDLALIAAEMAANEKDVKAWYTQRLAAWRREQGLSDCFGQV